MTLIEKDVGGIKLIGVSVAGEETVIGAPEYNVCFDIGRAPREVIPIDTVCLSHGHIDHCNGIAYYLSHRGFLGCCPGTVLVPVQIAHHLQALMGIWANIEGHPTPARIVGLEPDEDFELRRDLIIRPFAVNHGGPAMGYSLISVRQKLKPEFADRTGRELADLKKKGVVIANRLEVPVIAYCGDTAKGAFLDLDHVRNASILLLECTFFDEDHVSRARAGKHIHVGDLPEVLPRLRNPNIVLIHLTRRTFLRDARRRLRQLVTAEDWSRLSFFMERPRNPSPPPGEIRGPESPDDGTPPA